MNELAAHVRCGRLAIIRFGAFEMDDETGELRRQGRRVHLAAKPFAALALLTTRAGDLVTREELRRHLWGDDTFVDFDRGLNFAIAEVRAALNDQARSPRFIETVPKRGYRFVADVHLDRPAGPVPALPHRAGIQLTTAALLIVAIAMVCVEQPRPASAHTRRTADPIALVQFERALEAHDDAASRREGIAALRAATSLDPRFAEAHYVLAEYTWDLVMKRELPLTTATDEARLAAERAIALEDVAESRRLLALILLVADWDWRGARREMRRAIELEPKWDVGQAIYARMLSAAGDDAAASAAIDRAQAISPACDLIRFEAGQVYARAGRYDEALNSFDLALEYGPPRDRTATEWLKQVRSEQFKIFMAQGRLTDAHRAAAGIVDASGVSREVARGFVADRAIDAIESFLQRSIELNTRATELAGLEALRGRTDAALGWLEQAAWERDPELVWVLRNPEFTRLRALPRFQALDARVRRAVNR